MAKKKNLPAGMGDNVKQVLADHVHDIEKIAEEMAAVRKRLNQAYNQAKADGFDTVPLKQVIRERALKNEVRVARNQKVSEYKHHLGMNDMLSDNGSPTEDDADKEAA